MKGKECEKKEKEGGRGKEEGEGGKRRTKKKDEGEE